MENLIAKLLHHFENGKINRRRLIQSVALTSGAALVARAFPAAGFARKAAPAGAAGKAFPVTTMNHLALAVADYAPSRDFYVEVFGMRVVWDDGKQCALEFGSLTEPNGIYIRPLGRPTDKPGVGHFAFGVPTAYFVEHKAAMKTEMERRGLRNIRPDGEVGWIANDPAGYMLNTWAPIKDKAMYPGAASPCEVAASAKCQAGYEAGLKNLSTAPKPSGKGFQALYYSHIVLNVPEAGIPKEKEFYSGMYGMKVIYDQPANPAKKQNPQVFLRFGRNTLYLRPTANPGDKPYCNHFAFVVENYNQNTAEAKLKALGYDPQPDSKLGWTIADSDGMRIEVAGPGLPEHIAHDCHGANTSCPGGPKG